MSLREALVYLDGLGFDHLYPAARAPRAAVHAPSSALHTTRPVPDDPAPVEARSQPLPPQGTMALAPSERLQRLDEVRRAAEGCQACGLCRRRKSVVFGSGDPDAALMFVGEGPGAEEDRQGLPFVGAAGELLTKIIAAIGLERDQVYIANMVKCRPPDNRDPKPEELDACRAFLDHQIDLVRPRVLVALGRVAAQALLRSGDSLGRLRGRWHDVRGVAVRATYHPAALLRYPKYKRPTWEDMQVVRDRLADLS